MFVMFSSDLMCIVCLSAITSCEVASLSHWDLIYSFIFRGSSDCRQLGEEGAAFVTLRFN